MQIHASKLPENPESGAYNLVGEDGYWTDFALAKLAPAHVRQSPAYHVFDKAARLADILASLWMVSFTGEPNVIAVRDCSDFALSDQKGHNALLQALTDGIEPNTLILSEAKLTAAESKFFTVIDCGRLTKFDALKEINGLFAHGIERKAADMLAEYTNCDFAAIKNESEKLTAYSDGRQITAADVEYVCTEDSEVQVFQFVNNVIIGNNEIALKQMEKLKKRGESGTAVLAMITNQFRRMLHSALSDKSDVELAAIFKVKEYAIKKARELKVFSTPKLKRVTEMLTDYEYRIKSGEINESAALSCVVARLMAKEVI